MKFSTLMFVFIFYFIMHIFSTAALFHSTYIAVVEAIAKNLILKSNFFVKSKSLLATQPSMAYVLFIFQFLRQRLTQSTFMIFIFYFPASLLSRMVADVVIIEKDLYEYLNTQIFFMWLHLAIIQVLPSYKAEKYIIYYYLCLLLDCIFTFFIFMNS